MEVLHHPVLQVFHWTCMAAMIGMALDPTGIGATMGNYFGHIGDGLGNWFNGASGAEVVAHSSHAANATAASTAAAPAAAATSHAAHTASVSHAATIAPPGIETAAHAHHDFAAAAGAAPDVAGQMFESRSAWFESLSEATQTQYEQYASQLGISVEEYTRGFCGTGIPDNWGPK